MKRWRLWSVGLAVLASLAAAGDDAAGGLKAHLDALKDTKSIAAKFTCEKRLAALETPLVSSGRLWILKDPKKDDASIRFSTEEPYRSELILTDGQMFARSQHETEWTKQQQSSRPGLTAVMGQLGGWSTGDVRRLGEMYTVTRETREEPARPGASGGGEKLDMFVLTPTNKDLLKAVKRLSVGIDPASHQLRFMEIVTQQDDATRYWFYDAKLNSELPANLFQPADAPAEAK